MTDQSALETTEALPSAYAPFLPLLDRLSDPLQQLLRGQLIQFERHLRLSDHEQFAQTGEFEGLGGLTTRGEISHIVQSELLLRTQAPLEFLRRLAESETLFHEKRYADPGARHVYRLMISCGPGLLGHGRILALAALFFIARVARQRRASFHWCVLPRADGPVWFDELSVNTVKRFLRAASFRDMTTEDHAEALAVQDETADDLGRDVRISDWVIGEQTPRRGEANIAVIARAPNALRFALAAPVAGEPRTAQIFVRQNGWERSRATIEFPDDRICVSALANPFQPFRSPATASQAANTVPPRRGWEPQHLMILNAQTKIVRLRDGILILTSGKHDFTHKWFVPLRPGLDLAGILVEYELKLLLHSQDEQGDLLTYLAFSLQPDRNPVAQLQRQKRSTTAQLFNNRSPHAIPILTLGDDLEFYAASGRPLHLRFDREHQETNLAWGHKEPPVVLATGTHRVVKDRSGPQPALRALKGHRVRADAFSIPDDFPDSPHGLVYSSSERGTAYSLRPGNWIVPGPAGGGADRAITLAPGETLLSARWHENGVGARIWSDARYGGDGTVRTIRRDEAGEEVRRRPALKLGPDALSISTIQLADDGLWSVVVDEEGFPATLLRHRFTKRKSTYDERRHDLRELRRAAVVIDLPKICG